MCNLTNYKTVKQLLLYIVADFYHCYIYQLGYSGKTTVYRVYAVVKLYRPTINNIGLLKLYRPTINLL